MPCDYREYPPNWKTEIVPRILRRAGEIRDEKGKILVEACCEFCNQMNHCAGYRTEDGRFWPLDGSHGDEVNKVIKIVLTVAHLDHDHKNHSVSDSRLKALCQKCHNAYDAPQRALNRKKVLV